MKRAREEEKKEKKSDNLSVTKDVYWAQFRILLLALRSIQENSELAIPDDIIGILKSYLLYFHTHRKVAFSYIWEPLRVEYQILCLTGGLSSLAKEIPVWPGRKIMFKSYYTVNLPMVKKKMHHDDDLFRALTETLYSDILIFAVETIDAIFGVIWFDIH